MRNVVLYTLTSIDGVAESPDQYVLEFDDHMRENLARVVSTQDGVILGRHSYEEWAGYWPRSTEAPFAPFINGVDKYVVTSTRPHVSWDRTTVVARPVRELVEELKSRAGGGRVRHLFGSSASTRRLELLEAEPTASGALLLRYRIAHTAPGRRTQATS